MAEDRGPMTSRIRIARDGNVAQILLDDPPENRLARSSIAGLRSATTDLEGDAAIGAVVVTGAGATFSRGLDLTEWSELSSKESLDALQLGFEAYWALEHMTKPTIAAMEGDAIGAGAELALACDFRVASRSVRFAMPQVDLAWMPSHGGTARLSRIVGRSTSLELLLSGRTLDAAELQSLGLATAVTPEGGAVDRAVELATSFASKSRRAVRAIKRTLTEGDEKPYRNRFLLETQHAAQLMSSEEYRAALSATRKRADR